MAITRFAGSTGLIYALLVQPALAQWTPVSPLAPVRVAVAVPAGSGLLRVERPGPKLANRPVPRTVPAPIVVLNSRTIVGEQTLRRLNPQAVEAVHIYNPGSLPPGWTSPLATNVVDIKLKKGRRVPSLPLTALKRRLHLKGQVRYEQDGQPLPAALLRVAKADLPLLTTQTLVPGSTVVLLSGIVLPPRRDEAAQPERSILRGVASHY